MRYSNELRSLVFWKWCTFIETELRSYSLFPRPHIWHIRRHFHRWARMWTEF